MIAALLVALSTPPARAADCSAVRAVAARVLVSDDEAAWARAAEALASCGGSVPLPAAVAREAPATVRREPAPASVGDCEEVRAQLGVLQASGMNISTFATLIARCGLTSVAPPLQAVPAPAKPSPVVRGKWSFATAVETSGYGFRIHPILHRRKFHAGIDFDARSGDLVPALAAGVVIFAGPRSGYGNVIEIEHGTGGHRTFYAHNARLLVHVGDAVVAGQAIGEAGRTGMATGVHVHLEVHEGRQHVDPTPYLADPALLFVAPERIR